MCFEQYSREQQWPEVLTLTFRSLQVLHPVFDFVWLRSRRAACKGDATREGSDVSLLCVFEALWSRSLSLVMLLVTWSIVGMFIGTVPVRRYLVVVRVLSEATSLRPPARVRICEQSEWRWVMDLD